MLRHTNYLEIKDIDNRNPEGKHSVNLPMQTAPRTHSERDVHISQEPEVSNASYHRGSSWEILLMLLKPFM